VKACFCGGPRDGEVDDIGSDILVGDNFLAVHQPNLLVPIAPVRAPFDLKPGRVEYHHYVCETVRTPFGLYRWKGQITEQRVASLMPSVFAYDQDCGLVYRQPRSTSQ
jgi:hypothetical protein